MSDAMGGVMDDVTGVFDKVKDWLNEHPEASNVILIALQRLQGLLKQAGLPDVPDKPVGADALRNMAKDAIGNLKASQSLLEKFIHASLEGTDSLIDVLEMLVVEVTS